MAPPLIARSCVVVPQAASSDAANRTDIGARRVVMMSSKFGASRPVSACSAPRDLFPEAAHDQREA
jgi:hypothetical protein